jgi:hypothetical protein
MMTTRRAVSWMFSISTVVTFTLAACSSPDRQGEGSAGSTSQADLGDRCGANRTLVPAGASCSYKGGYYAIGFTAVGNAVQQGSPPADYIDCSYTMFGCEWGAGATSTTTPECLAGSVAPACPAEPSAKISPPTVSGVVLPVPDGTSLPDQASRNYFCVSNLPAANKSEMITACKAQKTSQDLTGSTCCVPRTTQDAGGATDGGGAQSG